LERNLLRQSTALVL